MTAYDLSTWRPTDHEGLGRHARVLVRAEKRYSRRAAAYEAGRHSTVPVDTMRLALLVVDADRLVRDLARIP